MDSPHSSNDEHIMLPIVARLGRGLSDKSSSLWEESKDTLSVLILFIAELFVPALAQRQLNTN